MRNNGNNSSIAILETAYEPTLRFSEYLRALLYHRRFIAKGALASLLVAALLAFVLPPQYESSARLMPPDKQSSGGLALLAGVMDEKMAGLAADALGAKTSGAVFVGVLQSRTVQDRLIDRLQLMTVYKVKLRRDARKVLAKNTEVSEDKKTGIITITVTDKSAQRACELARAYVEELNKLNSELNTTAAHRERVFLEERLGNVKHELSEASTKLSEFSSKNRAIDPRDQGKAMFDTAAKLQGTLTAAEAEVSALKATYTENNIRVRAANARVAQLRSKLSQIEGGTGADGNLPSLKELPNLGVTYYDLYRDVKVQEAVFEVLTKQYELAKVQEAKELPSVRILDQPEIPERKTSPQRILMMLSGLLLGGILACCVVIARTTVTSLSAEHPVRITGFEFRRELSSDVQSLRKRLRRKPEEIEHSN